MEKADETGKYKKIERIGGGAYGDVFKGVNSETGDSVAMKKVKIELSKEGVPSSALREIASLKELEHPNIVKLLDIVCKIGKLYLIFEYIESDLKKVIRSKKKFTANDVRRMMYQILLGVKECHSKRIMHRDLKPDNILIDSKGVIKVADFGLARAFSIPTKPYTDEVVTLYYRAPEITLRAREYSVPVDMWSVGCIFAEFFTHTPIFKCDAELDLLWKNFKMLGTPNEDDWPGVTELFESFKGTLPTFVPQNLKDLIPDIDEDGLDLLRQMLTFDPSKRISAKAALQHAYFKPILDK